MSFLAKVTSNGTVAESGEPTPASAAPVEFAIARATGPRTAGGKAIAAQNSITAGLFSCRPVIRGAESEDEWNAYRSALVDSLAPANAMELALAERAALYLWRLRRVERYEAEAAADRLDRVERDAAPDEADGLDSLRLAVAREEKTLARLIRLPTLKDNSPVPSEEAHDIISLAASELDDVDETTITVPGVPGNVQIYSFFDWTAGLVRDVLTYLASLSSGSEQSWPDGKSLLAQLTDNAEHALSGAWDQVAAAEREADRLRRRRAFPPAKAMDKVIRAEAHLSRQFTSALHELEALQNRRNGLAANLARLDVSGDEPPIPNRTP
jgi:hypothetical protein